MPNNLTLRVRQELEVPSNTEVYSSVSPNGKLIIYQTDTDLRIFKYLENSLVRRFDVGAKVSAFWLNNDRILLMFSKRASFSGLVGHIFIYQISTNSLIPIDTINTKDGKLLETNENWIFLTKKNNSDFALVNHDKSENIFYVIHYRRISGNNYQRNYYDEIYHDDSVEVNRNLFSVTWNKQLPSFILLFKKVDKSGYKKLIVNHFRKNYRWEDKDFPVDIDILNSNKLGFSLTFKNEFFLLREVTAEEDAKLFMYDTLSEKFVDLDISIPNKESIVLFLEEHGRYLFYSYLDSSSLYIVDIYLKETTVIENYIERRAEVDFSDIVKNTLSVTIADEDPIDIGLRVSGPPLNAINAYSYFNASSTANIELDVLEWTVVDEEGTDVEFEVVSPSLIRLSHPDPVSLKIEAKFELDDVNKDKYDREFRVVDNAIITSPPVINSLGCGTLVFLTAGIDGDPSRYNIEWVQLEGPTVEIFNADSLVMHFVRSSAAFGSSDEFYKFRMYVDRNTIAEKFIDVDISGEPSDKVNFNYSVLEKKRVVKRQPITSRITRIRPNPRYDLINCEVSLVIAGKDKDWRRLEIYTLNRDGSVGDLVFTSKEAGFSGTILLATDKKYILFDVFKNFSEVGKEERITNGLIYSFKNDFGFTIGELDRNNYVDSLFLAEDSFTFNSDYTTSKSSLFLRRSSLTRVSLVVEEDYKNIEIGFSSNKNNRANILNRTILNFIVYDGINEINFSSIVNTRFFFRRSEFNRIELGV